MSSIGKTRFLFGQIAPALGLFAVVAAFSPNARSADVTWGGEYRMEAIKIQDPELSSNGSNKSYVLQHLILNPKIVAADGVTVYSRLDVLNNRYFGITDDGNVQSVAGDVLGDGPGQKTSTNETNSNVLGGTQRASTIAVTELYITYNQEFGQLIAGRVPMQFGLGTALNAGNGLFDHYISTKDIVGYKAVLGNLYILPMIGKDSEPVLGLDNDVNDYLIQVEYDNPETDLQLGALYEKRVWTYAASDLPASQTSPNNIGDTNGKGAATIGNGGNTTLISVFSRQRLGDFSVGAEVDLASGDFGVTTYNGNDVSLNGYGIAAEVGYKPENSKTSGMFKFGIATGDDPGTNESVEGYAFNRNYDVAMLLFNHPLGQRDFLRTGLYRDTTLNASGSTTVNNQIDTEAISNAIYFAPSLKIQQRDSFSYGGTFIYALLNKDPIGMGKGTSTDLGYEFDLNITYKPMERVTWISEAGLLIPGKAWEAGSEGLENKFCYGLQTKAAISF